MTKDVGLKQGVSVKSRPLCGEVSLNLVDGIENILKTKSIAPLGRHRGTASLRTIFSNLPLHATFVNNIDSHPQKFAQFHQQTALVKQCSAVVKTNNQVEVRLVAVIASRHRAKYPYIVGAVAAGDTQNPIAFLSQHFLS